MSVGYVPVQWNNHKKNYDVLAILGICLYILVFSSVSILFMPENQKLNTMVVLIRAFGTCAVILLNIILVIGPLARLNVLFTPFLYNRRHLGVMTCIVALVHAFLVVLFYHGFGVINPILSVFTSNVEYQSISAFPFEVFGVVALLGLILLASISHDFWQKNLGQKLWKSIHMLIYVIYIAVIFHIILGALQSEQSLVYSSLTFLSALTVTGLHLLSGFRENDVDSELFESAWVRVDKFNEFKLNKARVVTPPRGERIAVYMKRGSLR